MKKINILLVGIVSITMGIKAQDVSQNMSKSIDNKIVLGKTFQIDTSNDGKERQFPFIYKFGQNIFVSYSEHYDAVLAAGGGALMISRDNGKTWGEKKSNPDFYFSSMFEIKGVLYGVVYNTYPISGTKEKMIYWISKNDGRSWERKQGMVHTTKDRPFDGSKGIWGSLLFHRGMEVGKNGTIQGVMYGRLNHEKTFSSAWVSSKNKGKDWKVRTVIAKHTPINSKNKKDGFCEPTFIKTRDGSLLCVMRIDSYLPLVQARSFDNGRTWSTPQVLPGLTKLTAQSVDPQLLLMDNGILALCYGRPNVRLAFSSDGCGYHWDESLVAYKGETTGYSGIIQISRNKILLVSDQGRTGARQKAIWGKEVEVNLIPTAITK